MNLPTPFGSYRVTQTFGENPAIYRQFGMVGHNGVDIAGLPRNYCFVPGEVIERGFSAGGYGNFVKIKDSEGRTWIYGHFAQPVTVTGHVNQWQDLGPMGTTGFSTGVHCHIGVKPAQPNQQNGFLGSIDPLPILIKQLNQLTEQDMQELQELKQMIKDTQNHIQKLENMMTNKNGDNRLQVTGQTVQAIAEKVGAKTE